MTPDQDVRTFSNALTTLAISLASNVPDPIPTSWSASATGNQKRAMAMAWMWHLAVIEIAGVAFRLRTHPLQGIGNDSYPDPGGSVQDKLRKWAWHDAVKTANIDGALLRAADYIDAAEAAQAVIDNATAR